MNSVIEEDVFGLQESVDLDNHRQCLQWLQQTCRPVFKKELSQMRSVPVPITADNAKDPELIGGIQQIQVANWKEYQVQVVTMDKWGTPQDVLQEVRTVSHTHTHTYIHIYSRLSPITFTHYHVHHKQTHTQLHPSSNCVPFPQQAFISVELSFRPHASLCTL